MTKRGNKKPPKANERRNKRNKGLKKRASASKKKPERLEISLEELKAIVSRAKSETLSDEEAEKLDAAVDTLGVITQELEEKGASIRRLRRLIFGPSTEKTSRIFRETEEEASPKTGEDADTKESSQTKESEAEASEEKEKETGDETGTGEKNWQGEESEKKKRKGHGRNGADKFTGAKRIKMAHETLKHGDPCPECLRGKVYTQKDPACLVRVTGMAPLHATVCELERLRCNACGKVFTARAPEGVGEERYDASAAAMIGLLKYGCGLPFNRLERLEADLGIPLPASTQWEVVHPAAVTLAPVYTELICQAAQGEVFYNDDTTARILALEGLDRGKYFLDSDDEGEKPGPDRTGIYTSGIVSVKDGRRIAAFFTGKKHAGENLADVLRKRASDLGAPIQMSDGLSRNTPGDFETIHAECNAHARRKYVDEAEDFPGEVKYVLDIYEAVYANDNETKKLKMTNEERLAYHQEHSAPLMTELKEWCKQQLDEHKVEENSGLGQAIRYMQKHRDKLILFLSVPGAPLDNNICERILKKAILHRKNALFFKTENGAFVGDLFMTMIHTAELAEINVYDYLVTLLQHPQEIAQNPADFMPWNYKETLEHLRTEKETANPNVE